MRLAPAEAALLQALVTGRHLKTHRTLDGEKVSKLHEADGTVVGIVPAETVQHLVELGLLAGNMKFPAATYLLTARGASVASSLSDEAASPLTVRTPPRAG